MKVFDNKTFTGHWPVGSAAIVVAADQEDAARLLRLTLIKSGLKGDVGIKDMVHVNTRQFQAIILCDGNY